MVSVASAGGRRVCAVPPVSVPAASRALPVQVAAAVLSRMWRAGSVSVLLGAAALVWLLGTLLSPANATTATSATTLAVSAPSVVVRTVADVAGGPSGDSGGGGGVAPKPASSSPSSGSGSDSGGGSSAPKPAATPSSSASGSSGSSGSSADSSATPKPAQPAPSASAAPQNSGASPPAKPAPQASPAAQDTTAPTATPAPPPAQPAANASAAPANPGGPKPPRPAADTTATPPTTGAPKPITPTPGAATQTACGTTGAACSAVPKTVPVTDNSTSPQITGAPKPARPATGVADASVCGAGGPGCDRSVLGGVHSPTPATRGGGSSTSCGANGCPTPAPATPPAPGSPLGPSNAGTGGPGGPGHAGGSGAARLNAAGSTDPNTTGPVTSGPRQNTVDPNQSANTARGPPAPTTDPSQQSGLPTPTPAPGKPVPTRSSAATDGLDPVVSGTALGTIAGPTAPGRPTTSNTATGNDPNSVPGLGQFARPGATVPPFPAQQESGFVSSVHGFGQWVGLEPDPNLHNTGGGYVPAHDGIPAKVDEGEARFVDLTKPEAEVLGVLPVGRAVKGVKLGAEVAGAGVKAWQDSHPSSPPAARPTPARTPAEQPAVGSGPAAPVPPRAQTLPQASNGGSSDPAAGSGPGRVLPRPNRPSPGDGTARPAPRPAPTTAPAGRPRAGADVRPSGPAGSRPGQRVGGPRTDREPAPIGAGAPRPATGGPESPQALTIPGTRIAPARPQAPRIAEPAPVRTLPDTRPAPEAAPGAKPGLPAPVTRPRPGIGTTAGADTGPSTPTSPHQRPVLQPSGSDTDHNPHPQPLMRPGGQPDGPPTVGGGEKARGNRYQNGTLERWDNQQQRWQPIAGVDPGSAVERTPRRGLDPDSPVLTQAPTKPEALPKKGAGPPQVGDDGSWHWRGVTLGPAANRAVDDFLPKFREVGHGADGNGGIRAEMQKIERQIPGAHLEGLEYDLKGADRLKQKVATNLGKTPDASPDEILHGINDGMRYTLTIDTQHYAASVPLIEANLRSAGYERTSFVNYWKQARNPYQGINTQWRDSKSGLLFEVQYHTPESWHVKSETHDAYENRTNMNLPEPVRNAWSDYQKEYADLIPVPEGAKELK